MAGQGDGLAAVVVAVPSGVADAVGEGVLGSQVDVASGEAVGVAEAGVLWGVVVPGVWCVGAVTGGDGV